MDEEEIVNKELKELLDNRDALRLDLMMFLNKLSDADLLAYSVQHHIEGFWMSLEKAVLDEVNFKLEG